MRSDDAVEIMRASLALAFPTASAEGLTRAAETLIRWGSEDVEDHLDQELIARMLLDLLRVAGVAPRDFRPVDEDWDGDALRETAARYRTWSHSDGMAPLPFLPRPPDEPRGRRDPGGPFIPDDPDDPFGPGRR
ncbi:MULTISPECIES: hypothetical protein [Streptomyces]|uniref:hypothetical protein n=1 Tax=Streptomyces TaxID=1883 RepID=UPI00167A495B|nr:MULTISPECIES: hypothetical protein [Streptomyces]MBK3526710.1 hypothetical protein [Streptomyces sp. MBT70]GGR62446.1 hypothetical protein GCM10010236_14630 [Streptomyces eurythermus]